MTSDDVTARARAKGGKNMLPPGIYRRGQALWVRFMVHGQKEQREPVPPGKDGKPRSVRAALQYRSERITQLARGEVIADSRRLTVGMLLDGVLLDYEINGRASVDTAKTRIRMLKEAVGSRLAVTFSTEDVQRLQIEWQRAGLTPGTINRRCNLLRKAFRLAWRSGRFPRLLYVPKLEEHAARGVYIGEAAAEKIAANLPPYAVDPFTFALLNGTRKGHLAATERRFVDLDRGVIEWPAAVCKARVPHTLPLEGESLAIVERAMANARPWCRYLFHGRDCAPGRDPRTISKLYACLGNLRRGFEKACEAAGIVTGRKRGGLVWHCTRNTAATDLVAAGCTIDDVMKVGGWKTADVARRYDLGNLEALRARIAAARERGKVVRLADKRKAHGGEGVSAKRATRRDTERKRLWATAYHEAGHTVVGFHARSMPRLRRATIVTDPRQGSLGHVARYPTPAFVQKVNEGDWSPRTEVRFYEEIQTLFAGTIAEKRFVGRANHVGARADYKIIGDLILRLAGLGGAMQSALGRWLRLSAEAQVRARWREVEAVAAALVQHKTLRGHDAVAKVIFDGLGIERPTVIDEAPIAAGRMRGKVVRLADKRRTRG